MRQMTKSLASIAVLLAAAGSVHAQACSTSNTPVRFAEIAWDSGKFHTDIVRAIVERGFGCKVEVFPGTNPITHAALINGNLDFWVEYWQGRTESIEAAAKAGKIQIVGSLIDGGGVEGFYVPEYVIKGDAARGIKPLAPDLKSVSDLPKYQAVFKDDEDPGKGRIYNCPTGWSCEKDNNQRMKAYGLDASYNNFRPGTGASLDAAITSAYQRGRPIVFSYFAPSSILGKFNSVRLEEPAWTENCWKTINGSTQNDPCGSASPSTNLATLIGAHFATSNPEIVAAVSKINLPLDDVNQAIAHMTEHKTPSDKMALDYLRAHQDKVQSWLSPEAFKKFQASLQ